MGDFDDPIDREIFFTVFQEDLNKCKDVRTVVKECVHRGNQEVVPFDPSKAPHGFLTPSSIYLRGEMEANKIYIPLRLLECYDTESVRTALAFANFPPLEQLVKDAITEYTNKINKEALELIKPVNPNYSKSFF